MNSTLPLIVELLIMRTRPRMASALMLLPQPDSPTRPTVSPGAMAKLTPSTACTVPSWLSNVTARSATFSRLSPCTVTRLSKSFTRPLASHGPPPRKRRELGQRGKDSPFDAARSRTNMNEIALAPLDLATRLPFGISRWSHSEFANLVVTMTDEQGLVGFGEGAPNARYHESRDADALALDELTGALQAVDGPAAVEAFCAAQPGLPALRSALSAAAWDLAGKQAGEPVWQCYALAAARFADQADRLAGRDGKAHAVDGVDIAFLAVERHSEVGDLEQTVSLR